jgi:hypothetical protein
MAANCDSLTGAGSSKASSYKRHPTKADDKNSVWHYFLQGGESAKCILQSCGKIIKTVGGSTKGLHTHLSSKHGVDLRKQSIAHATSDANEPTMQPSAKKMKITSYFVDKQERSLAAVLSRMTARDGLPFSLFCTSADIREGLKARGFSELPKSANTVRSLVMGYSDKVRQAMISQIVQRLNEGRKFSLTFDEWTSFANRRYMNILFKHSPTKNDDVLQRLCEG